MHAATERFLRYVKIDTEAAPGREEFPSTESQREFGASLVRELQELGVMDARQDEYGYVYGTIPATQENRPVIGFVSHMDTAYAMSGKGVKPRIVEDYDGGDIPLNDRIHMKVKDFPDLLKYKGQDLIVTDGTTLLGADDKAGIAEIMTMAEHFLKNPSLPHGEIKIAFTPDEEVGRGVDFFDVEGFGADYAYTVDGGEIGEIEYENFNAAGARIRINGVSVHPGSSKGRMKNALLVGMEFQSMLPVFDNPMYTEDYEGFYHLEEMSGTVEAATMEYIIRDHDFEKFEQKKIFFQKAAEFMNEKYGAGTVETEITDSYYNMKSKVEPYMELVTQVKECMEEIGIEPIVTPIRGGTDGSRLSYMGLVCPNLCAGGHNFHGKFEFIPVASLEKITELLIKIVERAVKI